MIAQLFCDLENWFKSRNCNCTYLTKDKERILTTFKSIVPTPILGICGELEIYRDKQLVCIGAFCECSNAPASLGFSKFADGQSLETVVEKIQELQKEIYSQKQIPYLDELMRRREYFTDPYDVLQGYAQRFEYNLIISQTGT